MADPRFFAKLDLGYFENPKISDFIDDDPRVPILHLRAILYCRQHLTDGVFPIRQVARLASASYCGGQCDPQCDPQCDFCKAHDAGLFVRINARSAEVHDYLAHQEAAKKVENRSAAAQKAANVRWEQERDAQRNASRNATGNAGRNAKRNAEERRGEESNTPAPATPSRTSAPDRFPEFWSHYPKKRDRGHAAKAWKTAIKKVDAQTIIDGLQRQLPQLSSAEDRFIPYGATWLNGERWADEVHVTRTGMTFDAPTPDQLRYADE